MTALTDLYRELIIEPGKQALLILLLAFVVTFLFIRFSVRMIRAGVSWWPGNIDTGGVHVHHVVFGTVFMIVAGVMAFAPAGWGSPWWEILAALFGVGAALVLDEFALILHLRDVYWSEQGRLSVEAVMLGAALIGMLVLGALPLGIDGIEEPGGWSYVLAIVVNGLFVLVALVKGRVWLGVLGILFPLFALIGAVRIGRPESLWARWRYREGSRKLAKATRRAARSDARWTRVKHGIFDAVAGRPDRVEEPPPKDRAAVPDNAAVPDKAAVPDTTVHDR
jgi:hypothetical protein